jgi:N-acetylmuramoyl-L-alanine amidase
MVLLSAQRPARPVYRLPDPPLLLAPYRLPKAEAASLPYRVAGFVFRDFRATRPPATPVARQAAQASGASAALAATSSGKRSLTRVLGLKIGRVVIDPGHGGHDTGSISRSGVAEKDLTLDVAKRLGALITENLGSEVVYTRSDDSYVSLEERGAIANRSRADLFISIHANSSHHATATGVETYYLNFTSSPEALEVAARENAVSERSVNELGDLIKKIALKDKIDESREFAAKVQVALYNGASKAGNRTRDRGVRKAPFVVLIGASMPSILTEIGFLSNAKEESLLKKPEYRQKIAEALFRGVSQYTNTLSHFNLAQMAGQGTSPE